MVTVLDIMCTAHSRSSPQKNPFGQHCSRDHRPHRSRPICASGVRLGDRHTQHVLSISLKGAKGQGEHSFRSHAEPKTLTSVRRGPNPVSRLRSSLGLPVTPPLIGWW